MNFTAKATSLLKQRCSCAIVVVFEGGKLSAAAEAFDQANAKIVQQLDKQGDIKGKAGDTLMLHQVAGLPAQRVLLIGGGKQQHTSQAEFRKAMNAAVNALKAAKVADVSVFIDDLDVEGQSAEWKARQLAEIFSAATYQFEQLKSDKADAHKLKKVTLAVDGQLPAARKGLATGAAIAHGAAFTRDLGNLPGNVCTPSYLEKEAKRMARGHAKLTTSVLNEKQMRELGMGSLLSVSEGSDEPAKLIVMEYKGAAKSKRPHCLVGKGITFDSGGISLKPGGGMDEMKYDMCGAASVFGAMQAVIELEPAINLVAVIAAAENMPSGRATKPGDIVTSMAGLTIEVLNTDAEGRLVLCDALTYAERFKPLSVVDVATLTGACVVALGKHATGLYSNKDELAQELLSAGESAGDRAWHMPLWDEYQKQLDSNFADIANIGGPGGGSVTAACFLSRFAKKYDWAHLDIAGTAWTSGGNKGATGRPVPMLVQYLLNKAG